MSMNFEEKNYFWWHNVGVYIFKNIYNNATQNFYLSYENTFEGVF